jgi:predicted RNA binding protein YcfA (HicA-like mRNA interferase family)
MTRLPRITGQEMVDALCRAGFQVVRTRGSHVFLQHPDGRTTVVPVHRGETLGGGLTAKILRDCELTREQLEELL